MTTEPRVGVFWMVETAAGRVHLLTAAMLLAEAEPYGDFLTFGSGHYEVWSRWRSDKTLDRDVLVLVRTDEYEDWPRGRVVFDGVKQRFVIYADRKLLTVDRVAAITERFGIDPTAVVTHTDFHYRSRFTPKGEL